MLGPPCAGHVLLSQNQQYATVDRQRAQLPENASSALAEGQPAGVPRALNRSDCAHLRAQRCNPPNLELMTLSRMAPAFLLVAHCARLRGSSPRHLHAREMVGERVAVAKQRPDGQEWIVDPSHRREVDERRAKYKSGRRVLGRAGLPP